MADVQEEGAVGQPEAQEDSAQSALATEEAPGDAAKKSRVTPPRTSSLGGEPAQEGRRQAEGEDNHGQGEKRRHEDQAAPKAQKQASGGAKSRRLELGSGHQDHFGMLSDDESDEASTDGDQVFACITIDPGARDAAAPALQGPVRASTRAASVKASARTQAAGTGPMPRPGAGSGEGGEQRTKAHRNTYTPAVKEVVLKAYRMDGRHFAVQVGQLHGMPESTVDGLFARAKKIGDDAAIFDHRHDRNVHHFYKWEQWHEDFVSKLLLEDSTRTLKELRAFLNQEILRKILIRYAEDHGNETLGLEPEERATLAPLRLERLQLFFERAPEIAVDFGKQKVSGTTIDHHLRNSGVVLAYESPTQDETTVNSEETMHARRVYAQKIVRVLEERGGRNLVIFVDELAFRVALHEKRGWAKEETRKIPEAPSAGVLGQRFRGALAVSAGFGLMLADTVPVADEQTVRGGELTASECSTPAFGADEYRDFLNKLLHRLLTGSSLVSGTPVPNSSIIEGKTVWIVFDKVPEDLRRELAQGENALAGLSNYGAFATELAKLKSNVQILCAASSAAHLGLCNNYKRILLDWTNRRQDDPLTTLMKATGEKGGHTGMQHRLDALAEIVREGIDELYRCRDNLGETLRLHHFLINLVHRNGFFRLGDHQI